VTTPKMIFCFRCAGFREAKGSVQRDWGFGPRDFCAAHAHLVKEMPKREDLSVGAGAVQAVTTSTRKAVAKSARGGVSLASWCREAATRMTVDEVVAALPLQFPDSKPGKNPKLAKGYVNCYLKRSA